VFINVYILFSFNFICLHVGILALSLPRSSLVPTLKVEYNFVKENVYSQFYELRRLITSCEL
jgi:hypothetical protein